MDFFSLARIFIRFEQDFLFFDIFDSISVRDRDREKEYMRKNETKLESRL